MPIKVLRCEACGALDPGPRDLCVACQSDKLVPADVPGKGTLVSWTTIRRAPTRFRGQAPYVVAVVKLVSGLLITGRFQGAEERLHLDLPVAAVSEVDNAYTFAEYKT
ncbi:MAG: hypothetical protein BGN89_12635 [Alphaproteobacteria bacterium 64-6]|jgi:uncharacterized OB-fold protein|nr:OB-fold domain-containing protein [Hyphomicrobium sp.]OJU28069.1 MAG: hypothetical protein BGN89_12635 [Alphaproteobacteria bacterium 64-6]